MNRGIKAGEQLDAAHAYMFDCLSSDLEHHDPGESVDYSILFLRAYLDAHRSFGSISQSKADAIMEHLSERYEIADLVE
nr:hypothetical protein [uncultured Desulfobulbus sp.]